MKYRLQGNNNERKREKKMQTKHLDVTEFPIDSMYAIMKEVNDHFDF